MISTPTLAIIELSVNNPSVSAYAEPAPLQGSQDRRAKFATTACVINNLAQIPRADDIRRYCVRRRIERKQTAPKAKAGQEKQASQPVPLSGESFLLNDLPSEQRKLFYYMPHGKSSVFVFRLLSLCSVTIDVRLRV